MLQMMHKTEDNNKEILHRPL